MCFISELIDTVYLYCLSYHSLQQASIHKSRNKTSKSTTSPHQPEMKTDSRSAIVGLLLTRTMRAAPKKKYTSSLFNSFIRQLPLCYCYLLLLAFHQLTQHLRRFFAPAGNFGKVCTKIVQFPEIGNIMQNCAMRNMSFLWQVKFTTLPCHTTPKLPLVLLVPCPYAAAQVTPQPPAAGPLPAVRPRLLPPPLLPPLTSAAGAP